MAAGAHGTRQNVVTGEADPEDEEAVGPALVYGKDERDRADEMGCEPKEQASLPEALADKAHMTMAEVPQASMDEARRAAAGARGEVALLDEGNGQVLA